MTLVIRTLTTRKKSQKWASAEQKRQAAEYEAWQRKHGIDPTSRKKRVLPLESLTLTSTSYVRETPHYPSRTTLTQPHATARRRSVLDSLATERPEIADEIRRKATATAPAYNKGAYQYITPETDLTTLGRKV